MSLEKTIVLSSSDKEVNSTSNSDFVVQLKADSYTQGVNRIMVKDVSIPNVFYNVRGAGYGSAQNNLLLIDDNVGYLPFTIPEGQYVISTLGTPPANDLLTTIENLVNPAIAPDTLSLSFDEVTQKIVWTWSSLLYRFVPKSEGNLAAPLLGIAEGDQNIVGLVQTPSYVPALQGYDMVYVQSKDIAESGGIDGDFGLIPLICGVSLADTPFGNYAYRQDNDGELAEIRYDSPRNLQRITITLRDVDGNKLDIGTNTMTITFKVFFSAR